MDPLRISALGSTGLTPLRPPLALPKAQESVLGTSGLPIQALVQGLTQNLVQQALQTAVTPTAEPATTGSDLTQSFAASLLAALNAPQAAAATTTAATSTLTSPATDPTLATPLPATATATAVPADAQALQTTVETGASLDFALQTALRFGAGVVAQAAPALQPADLGASLVRDAAAVPRINSLQPDAGRPGPEAFTGRLQPQVQRVLQIYQGTPPAAAPGHVDQLA